MRTAQQLNDLDSKSRSIEHGVVTQHNIISGAQGAGKRERLLSWLSDCDEEGMHIAIREPRVQGTGDWVCMADS